LSPTTPLPSQNVVLTVTENKKQMIALICEDILTDIVWQTQHTQTHKLVITGQDDVPHEIFCAKTSLRSDMITMHEEADNIIVQQAITVAFLGVTKVIVISDDTDVFILLLHYYLQQKITVQIIMESPIRNRTVIDIGSTVLQHKTIIPDLLAAHALSGCDTTASCFGIGKGKVVKALRQGHSLSCLGDEKSDPTDVI